MTASEKEAKKKELQKAIDDLEAAQIEEKKDEKAASEVKEAKQAVADAIVGTAAEVKEVEPTRAERVKAATTLMSEETGQSLLVVARRLQQLLDRAETEPEKLEKKIEKAVTPIGLFDFLGFKK